MRFPTESKTLTVKWLLSAMKTLPMASMSIPNGALSDTRLTPFANEVARGIEHLDAIRTGIRDVDLTQSVDGDPDRMLEGPVGRAGSPPLADELAVRVEDLHPVVAGVADEDVARAVDVDPEGP